MKKILIVTIIFLSCKIVFADEPGEWQRHFKKSINSLSGAFDPKLSGKIRTTKNLVIEKGCRDKQDVDCEKIRANYVEAISDYLVNAKNKVDEAIKFADLAYTASRKSGMKMKSTKALQLDIKGQHNEIVKTQYLNELAIKYDPSTPILITDEILKSIHETEIGLNNQLLGLKDDYGVTIERWRFALKQISNNINSRLGIIRIHATEGTIVATGIGLCLSAGKPLSECSNIDPGVVIDSVTEPLKDMSEILGRGKKRTYSLPKEEVDKAREYYKTYH